MDLAGSCLPGGENNIAAFTLDAAGVPTLLQHIDSGGLHPRTISLDRSEGFLIAGNIAPTLMDVGGAATAIPANVTLFRVGSGGRLSLVRSYPMDVGSEMVWWSGFFD